MANAQTVSGIGVRPRKAKLRSYWMGVPFTLAGAQEEVLDDLYKLHQAEGTEEERNTWQSTDRFLYEVSGRLTDKSAAILQIISVIAAIGLVLLPPSDLPAISSRFSVASTLAFSLSAMLLWLNLFQRWPNAGFRGQRNSRNLAACRHEWRLGILHIIQWRTLRHTFALWVIGLGGLLFFSGLVAKFEPEVRRHWPAQWVLPFMRNDAAFEGDAPLTPPLAQTPIVAPQISGAALNSVPPVQTPIVQPQTNAAPRMPPVAIAPLSTNAGVDQGPVVPTPAEGQAGSPPSQ